MNRRVFVTLVALAVLFVLGGASAYAQTIKADIGFPFVAGGKEMAAGSYSVDAPAGGPIVLTGPGGARSVLMVITQLGRHDKDPDPEFVFDKIDGKALLSEIWIPGKDGLLVLSSKGPHEHAVVGGSNPHK